MTTHRHIQVAVLLDNLESKSRTLVKAIRNAEKRGFFGYINDAKPRLARINSLIYRVKYRLDPHNNPPCNHESTPEQCKYAQPFTSFSLQTNALRSELASLIHPVRCGSMLKESRIGGHPLDYQPCRRTGV